MRFTGRRPTLEEIVNLGVPVFPVNIWWDTKKQKWQKTPAISKKNGGHGHRDAVKGEAARALFARAVDERGRPRWNSVGVPTGAVLGATVVDDDPRKGTAPWLADHRLGGTRRHTTWSHGSHWFFKYEPGLKTGSDRPVRGIDIRNDGGWVVWWPVHDGPIENAGVLAELPPWFVEQCHAASAAGGGQDRTTKSSPGGENGGASELLTRLGTPPAHIGGTTGIDASRPKLAQRGLATQAPFELVAHNVARVRGALAAIDRTKLGRDEWLALGMSLHSLQWDRSDGSDVGLELWDEFSAPSEHYNFDKLEYTWKSFGMPVEGRRPRTIGTLFDMAHQHGWRGQVVMPPETTVSDAGTGAPAGSFNGAVNGHYALPAVFTAPAAVAGGPIFVDNTTTGAPKATPANARIALRALELSCRHDQFHDKFMVGGRVIEQWTGELTDNAVQVLKGTIHERWKFEPSAEHMYSALMQECLAHSFHPIKDYFDGLVWDGVPRISTWLRDYLSAPDDPFTREIGRLALVAAVRRIEEPGCKFDEIIVFESAEGKGKSTTLEILAGTENHSDQEILTLSDRAQQEQLQGVWLYEIGELAGLRRADVERVKLFASRRSDRARPAYGRMRVDRPRQCVFFGTTNDSKYLTSQTGNRRFWPIRTGKVNLDGLRRVRDQLWAEAVELEATGMSLRLPEALWADAAHAQDARMVHDPWIDLLADIASREKHCYPLADGTGRQELRVTSKTLYVHYLGLTAEKLNVPASKRLAFVMEKLGWHGPTPKWVDGKTQNAYTKLVEP
ncbi:MAG TPA: VapE domain-containing protein [Xanthobacteraceae bacterium]|nr:VapE domain-containing protein [Xanthobacteraceae bacterium]